MALCLNNFDIEQRLIYLIFLIYLSSWSKKKNKKNYQFPISTPLVSGFRSVVVITSALHAEGHRFEPGRKQLFFFSYGTITCYPSVASALEN